MRFADDPGAPPTPERLAAYVDGELPEPEGRVVEAWLAAHPAAAAEVAALRRLDRLLEEAAPPEPNATSWETVRSRIEVALAADRPAARRRGLRVASVAAWLALGAAAAAVLFLALQPAGPLPPAGLVVEEPWPVLAEDEVDILRLDASALSAVVVGDVPARGHLVLASAADVEVNRVVPEADWMAADLRVVEGPEPPLVWTPLSPEP